MTNLEPLTAEMLSSLIYPCMVVSRESRIFAGTLKLEAGKSYRATGWAKVADQYVINIDWGDRNEGFFPQRFAIDREPELSQFYNTAPDVGAF